MKKIFIIFFLLSACSKNRINQEIIIKNFDLNRYLGTWYEIARTDNWFERNLINVKAQYILMEDGKVKIINSGYNIKKKKEKTIKGVAYLPKPNIGQLKISFFRPFYSDYNIVLLDKEYQYAVVIGENYNYLWILSRTPKISNKLYSELLLKIKKLNIKNDFILKKF